MPEYADSVADPNTYMPQQTPGAAHQDADGVDLAPVLEYISASGFTFEPWQVATFITALRTKPFMILAGISGTGKTKLPQLVGQATSAEVVIVPVRPDWTDSSDLLGYERLDGSFVPGRLLRVCWAAMQNHDKQYFFVLDEMNVARVEYYFAEVLSLMENRRRDDAGVVITDPLNRQARNEFSLSPEPIHAVDWSQVYLPSNVSIIGTVNMDETTHGFSRKVLDRAFVLELSDVDLSEIGSAQSNPQVPPAWTAARWQSLSMRLSESPDVSSDVVSEAVNALVRANEGLSQAQLQVGFRVRDEVALFCLNARQSAEHFVQGDQTVVSPLDLCLNMKILPRVQGGGALVREVLGELESWTAPASTQDDSTESPSGFPRTHERVRLMKRRLDQTGFTSYWV